MPGALQGCERSQIREVESRIGPGGLQCADQARADGQADLELPADLARAEVLRLERLLLHQLDHVSRQYQIDEHDDPHRRQVKRVTAAQRQIVSRILHVRHGRPE